MKKSPATSPLLIQQELRKRKSYLSVAYEYSLDARQVAANSSWIWFNNKEADLLNSLVRQCRGLILDSSNNWKVIARPFDSMFEWTHAAAPLRQLDWKSLKAVDSVDGYQIYMYNTGSEWVVASQGSPDASDIPPRHHASLRDIFWHAFAEMNYTPPPKSFDGCTFIWEVIGPKLCPVSFNRAPRNNNQLYLLGVRNNETGEETNPEIFADQEIRPYVTPFVDESDYKTIKEVADAIVETGLRYGKGYVLIDKKFNRVLVTHPEYHAARELRAKLSVEYIINNIQSRTPELEVRRYAPDWLELYDMIAHGYADLMRRVWKAWELHQHTTAAATFRDEILHYPFSSILFRLRAKSIATVSEGLRKTQPNTLLTWMEIGEDVKPVRLVIDNTQVAS